MAEFSKIIAPGDVAVIACPEGANPDLQAGDILPNAEDAQFFVIEVKDNSFTVGPLKAGAFKLDYKCGDGVSYSAMLETPFPDPKNLPEHGGPLGGIAYSLWSFWIALIAILVAIAIANFVLIKKKSRAKAMAQKQAEASKLAKKDSQQVLREMIATLETIEKSPGNPEIRSDDLYQKGYRSIRGFVEKELRLKTQAETTPQFLGSLKILAPKHHLSQELVHQIERSLVFADQNRFGAAATDSPEARAKYAADLKLILQALLRLSQRWRQEQIR